MRSGDESNENLVENSMIIDFNVLSMLMKGGLVVTIQWHSPLNMRKITIVGSASSHIQNFTQFFNYDFKISNSGKSMSNP